MDNNVKRYVYTDNSSIIVQEDTFKSVKAKLKLWNSWATITSQSP